MNQSSPSQGVTQFHEHNINQEVFKEVDGPFAGK